MKFSTMKEFAVLLFVPGSVRCCTFRRDAKGVRLKAFAHCTHDETDPAKAWKQVLRETSYSRVCPLILSGALKGGTFFRCAGVRLAPKAMRGALEFELPQRLLQDTANFELEFVALSGGEGENIPINVYAFPATDKERLAAMLTQSIGKADYFVYPLLALRESDGPVYLPGIESDFYFSEGGWHPVAELPPDWLSFWEKEMRGSFLLPEEPEFKLSEWLGCLLCARLAAAADVKHTFAGLNVLPRQLRPSRLRNQLRLTALLLVLLAVNFAWGLAGTLSGNHREYSRLTAARNRLRTEVMTSQRKLKTAEKELRELTRVINQSPGERDVIGKLARFSEVLPNNVMVTNLRWTDSSVDLTLRSEAESLNVPEMIRPLKFWKIEQIQQRRRNNDTTNTIMLKLVSSEERK